MNRAGTVRLAVAGVTIALVLAVAGFECQVLEKPVFGMKHKPLEKRLSYVRRSAPAVFPLREAWVTLNGFFVRMLNQHVCNGVIRSMSGRMLLRTSPHRMDMRPYEKRIDRFSRHCLKFGSRFAYVQVPKKLDRKQLMLPPGQVDAADANVDELLRRLSRKDVSVVDWRGMFAATPDEVMRSFYRTDHHWNNDAAFRAVSLLVEEIARLGRVPDTDLAAARRLLAPEQWRRELCISSFLGSFGRRTGPLFAGVDDRVFLLPRFQTDMELRIPRHGIRRSGSFENTIMYKPDSGDDEMMSMFVRMDGYPLRFSAISKKYPLLWHRNPGAPLKLNVLLIGDSFARPIETYLSTILERMVAVDPRRIDGREPSIAALVAKERPDVVIHLQSAHSFHAAKDADGTPVGGMAMFEYGL